MPRKYVKPELFARVFKFINGLKDKRNYVTVQRITKEINAKLKENGLTPDSRNVSIKVRRALKFGVQKKIFLIKDGKYHMAITQSPSKSLQNETVPLDSLDLLISNTSQRKSRNSDMKKCRCTRQEHISSCRKYRKRNGNSNKRYHSRKRKNRYLIESSSKTSSNSSGGNTTQLGGSTEEATNAETTKSESGEYQELNSAPTSSDIKHWDNKQEAIDKSKYGKQSRKSRMLDSSYDGSTTNSGGPKIRKNKKRKMKTVKKNLNVSTDNSGSCLSTTTAIAAAIMIMMSLWYGYR